MSEDYSVPERQEEDDYHVDRDRLSDLPLCIIHIILALIPIKEAGRTSVLSTQWRSTWTTLPQLVFNWSWEGRKFDTADTIDRVLFLHEGPIHRFRLSSSDTWFDPPQWTTCLSKNGIQELIFDMRGTWVYIKIESSLYSCEKLTDLRLYCCELNPPPLTFKGFLFLRCLCIDNIPPTLTSDDIGRIVAGCPVLESLKLAGIYTPDEEIKISAPNLKFMCVEGTYKRICINAPLVTEMSIYYTHLRNESVQEELKSSACDYAKCLGGFTNLQKLIGCNYFTEFMSFGIELYQHSLVFHHLKFIHVDVKFEDVKEIMVLARLVIGAPSLQELIIKFRYYIGMYESDSDLDSEAPPLSLEDLGFAPNFTLENLTDISLVDSDVIPLEAEFLKFLFQMSPVLQTVRIDTEENQNKVRAILQSCNWASPPIVKPCCKKTIADRFQQPF